MEISKPTEFTTYLQIANPIQTKKKNIQIQPPTREKPIEILQALHSPQEKMTRMRKPHTRGHLTEEDIPRLRQQWYNEFHDILQGTPETLPPLQEVNHKINIIDPNKKYVHRLPTCLVPLRPQFHEKINCYVDAGWWKEDPTSQAAPLMCIPKKNG